MIDLAEHLDRRARCLVIGEVAQAHDGSLGLAHAYIDAIADGGADAVKFQTHIAAAESSPGEPWRVKFSPQDATRYEYWKRMEFTPEQWEGLRRHADQRGLLFFSSPFSAEAVDLLTRVGVAGWKVASGEVANAPLFQRMADTGLPFLVSSGMSGWAEIDAVVRALRGRDLRFALMQCTSKYPCPPELVGLNVLGEMRQRYGCAVGLSDHSGTIYPGLAAAANGLEVLEVHVTMSRQMFGPDVSSSVTTVELRQLVDGLRFVESMRANPVDKDAVARDLRPLRDLFTQSVIVTAALSAGQVLSREHLSTRKPGTGIPAARLEELVGRRLLRDVTAQQQLAEADLEGLAS